MHSLQNIPFQRSRTNIMSYESFFEDNSHKQRQTFLTQRNIQADIQNQAKAVDLQHLVNLHKIQESHHQLVKFIDKLDVRVQQVMDHNEAQILFAYKNHVALVKRQMEQLRKQSQAQANSSSSHLERIQQLQKQLAIFREQSLELFRKVTERDKMIEQLNFQISELLNQKQYMNQSLKGAMRRNKELEVQLIQKKIKENQIQDDFTHKFDVSMIFMNNMKGKGYRNKNRTTLTSANVSKGATINIQNFTSSVKPTEKTNTIKYDQFSQNQQKNFEKNLRAKLDYLGPEVLNTIIQVAQLAYFQTERKNSGRLNAYFKQKEAVSRATKLSMRSKSNYTIDVEGPRPFTALSIAKHKEKQASFARQKDFKVKNQMSDYFIQCVEATKKEIIKKKNLNSLNFYKQGNPVTLNQFKKLDWFRLMQLFLSQQKVVQELYRILIDNKNG